MVVDMCRRIVTDPHYQPEFIATWETLDLERDSHLAHENGFA
jgi:hypothetical protein